MTTFNDIQSLVKAIEAGSYNAAPGTLVQGAALQVEDLSPVIHNVTWDNKHIRLQKMLSSTSCKSTTAQFDRQLSYGHFGGSAQLEGNVGRESTSEFVRVTVPMCFYSHVRRVTVASTMVATVDGKKSDERAAEDAAKKIAGDIEFDLFRGRADFSNAGVFDANPLAQPSESANMVGLDVHVRQSDILRNSQDQMFNEYGSDQSVVLPAGGALTQDIIEDAAVRSAMNMGEADELIVDPLCLANYNKISFGKERIILAGAAQEATGASLRKQWVSGGTVTLEASHFLRGKTSAAKTLDGSAAAPASISVARSAAGDATPFEAGEVYQYAVTAVNEAGGESPSATGSVTVVADGDTITVTINHPGSGTFRSFNVYRSEANGTRTKFIGRVVAAAGAASTSFVDLGNRLPGSVTGFLVQKDTMEIRELAPYSRLKMAVTDLSLPEAHFRFCTLAVMEPRKNVLLDSLL